MSAKQPQLEKQDISVATRTLNLDPYHNLLEYETRARLTKALSPSYVWSKLTTRLYELRHPKDPWITRDAIVIVDGLLRATDHGLEWGSGNGSLWFGERVASLTSVEHNPVWYERMAPRITAAGLTNVRYLLVREADYTSPIDGFADESLDFVLVDGLFRDQTFERSIPKVKAGGFIIFDNVNWHLPSDSTTPHSRSRQDGPETPLWGKVLDEIAPWRRIWTTNGINDTAIFFKPSYVPGIPAGRQ
jgi:hypothetical protein